MSRYVTRRVNGSWQVWDSEFHNFVMGEYGAGSTGYKQAQAVADGLNAKPPVQPVPAPVALAANDPVIPNNDLRSPSGLRTWRRAHKLSQKQLGELLDIHHLTVLRWEQGQVPIPRTTELALLYLDQVLADEAPRAAAV